MQKKKEDEIVTEVIEEHENRGCMCCTRCKQKFAEFDKVHFSPLFIKDINREDDERDMDKVKEKELEDIHPQLNDKERGPDFAEQ